MFQLLLSKFFLFLSKILLLFSLLISLISESFAQYQQYLYKPGISENINDVIKSTDANSFNNIVYLHQERVLMFDRREGKNINVNAYVFQVYWADSCAMKMYVNPEDYSFNDVNNQAIKHAKIIGLLPYCLRVLIDKVNMHMGYASYGGGNRGLLLYAKKTEEHEQQTHKLHEIIVNEAAHNLGNVIAKSIEWQKAQKLDRLFISKYAFDYPSREDVSESFLAWILVRFYENRLDEKQIDLIKNQIPARLDYFDKAKYKMFPVAIN